MANSIEEEIERRQIDEALVAIKDEIGLLEDGLNPGYTRDVVTALRDRLYVVLERIRAVGAVSP